MHRHSWLIAVLIAACSKSTPDTGLVAQPTRVRVSPEAFLGAVPCSEQGGMRLYQATLFDVTDGLEGAFELPSSDVVPCTADVEFGFVKSGRRYLAKVRGFDQSGVVAASPGSPLTVDEDGMRIEPRFTTTCWGQDGVTAEQLGLGGAGLGGAGMGSLGLGGADSSSPQIGVESFSKSVVTVRGCETLSDTGTTGTTKIAISIDAALVGLRCGDKPGRVTEFALAEGDAPAEAPGGAGGALSEPSAPTTASCGDELIVEASALGSELSYEVLGFETGNDQPIWRTTCRALPQEGTTVLASCDPASAL